MVRGVGKPQHLRILIQQLFLTGVAAALLGQPFHRIGVGHLHQMGLIAPLGHIELYLTARFSFRACCCSASLSGGSSSTAMIFWDLLIVQIIPGRNSPHGGNICRIVEKELPLIGQPPLPARRTAAQTLLGVPANATTSISTSGPRLSGPLSPW